MDFEKVAENKQGVIVHNIDHFDLGDILDNGQCFRWVKLEENHYSGVAFEKSLHLIKDGKNLVFQGSTLEDFYSIWKDYFDLGRNYGDVTALFSTDETLKKAVAFAPGLRVLRQEPWEALGSFILSQNNNIKRIAGLVDRFSENFGKKIDGGYGFPPPSSLYDKTPEDLAPVRAGFRSKYLIDAAQKIRDNTVSLDLPYTAPLDEAETHLMQIHGVGPKVSNCVLLFGFHRLEAFPVDVWVKRAMDYFYPQGLPKKFAPVAGLAQQYLFHYVRLNPELIPKDLG